MESVLEEEPSGACSGEKSRSLAAYEEGQERGGHRLSGRKWKWDMSRT